jgi:acyl-CoA thioesterase I
MMMKFIGKIAVMLSLSALLLGCAESPHSAPGARIITMGDSLLASNLRQQQSVSHLVEEQLGVPVLDRSVIGAQMDYLLPISGALGMSIPKQFVPGDWDWVILNGGGNDLWLGCGCIACKRTLESLISSDGTRGQIPALVDKLRKNRAKVIYVGYLRSPGFGSPIEHCRDLGNELERRIDLMAARDSGTSFLSLQDLVPPGDKSYHAPDRIHPSPKGSAAVAERIVRIITANAG